MIVQRTFHPLSAILIFTAFVGCSDASGPTDNIGDRLYFNSFESSADTAGWTRYGSMQLEGEASPEGGRFSVRVAGGCLHPHAALHIHGPARDSYLVLRCWGRNLAIGGGVSLMRTRDFTGALHISVSDTTWTFYQSPDTLFCPAGDTLRIEMSSGGIVNSAMLVDQLEVCAIR